MFVQDKGVLSFSCFWSIAFCYAHHWTLIFNPRDVEMKLDTPILRANQWIWCSLDLKFLVSSVCGHKQINLYRLGFMQSGVDCHRLVPQIVPLYIFFLFRSISFIYLIPNGPI